MAEPRKLYGLLAQFDDPGALVEAARRTRAEGFRRVDAFSPYPMHELDDALAIRATRLPLLVFVGGLIGALGGYFMQYYTAVHAYPFNVGDRPLHSWPAFIPVTFEMTILVAALAAVLGMLALNGLPMPYHPVFNVPSFALASRDRFFLCIESRDPLFDLEKTRAFLQGLGAREVSEVAP
jgi:hypothetical protein